MAFAQRVNRVTISGTMYGGSEIWTTGFYAGGASTDAPDPSVAMAEMIADEWQTFFTSATVKVAYLFKTATVKITPWKTDGTIDVPKIRSWSYPTAIEGAHTGNGNPPQVSLVATLIADSGVGLAGKGRMYLPGLGEGIDTTGHLSSGYTANVASALATFLSNVNASFDNPGQAINASHRPIVIGDPTPINRVLTSVRVGNVFDTQRRRRNALAETYASDTI